MRARALIQEIVHVSDEKNLDVQGDEEAARRLAEQRKALNLQTRPLEVIADLDWDVDDDDFPLPDEPAAPAAAAPAAAAPAASTERLKEAVEERGGTMMMSANDFRSSLQENAPAASAAPGSLAQDAVTTPSPTVTRGGTMLISGDDIEEAVAAARDGEEAAAAPVTAPGGTVLMSADAVTAQLEQEAEMRSTQPNSTVAADAASTENEFAAAPVQTSPNPDAGAGWDAPETSVAVQVPEVNEVTQKRIPPFALIAAAIVILGVIIFFVTR